jgi:hypothetical protein
VGRVAAEDSSSVAYHLTERGLAGRAQIDQIHRPLQGLRHGNDQVHALLSGQRVPRLHRQVDITVRPASPLCQ